MTVGRDTDFRITDAADLDNLLALAASSAASERITAVLRASATLERALRDALGIGRNDSNARAGKALELARQRGLVTHVGLTRQALNLRNKITHEKREPTPWEAVAIVGALMGAIEQLTGETRQPAAGIRECAKGEDVDTPAVVASATAVVPTLIIHSTPGPAAWIVVEELLGASRWRGLLDPAIEIQWWSPNDPNRVNPIRHFHARHGGTRGRTSYLHLDWPEAHMSCQVFPGVSSMRDVMERCLQLPGLFDLITEDLEGSDRNGGRDSLEVFCATLQGLGSRGRLTGKDTVEACRFLARLALARYRHGDLDRGDLSVSKLRRFGNEHEIQLGADHLASRGFLRRYLG